MEKELSNSIDELVSCIKNSNEYIECIRLKEKMSKNTDILDLINNIKKLQKQLIRTNDLSIKDQLKELEDKLNSIPIYISYNQYLEEVNYMINYVKDDLNDYFYELFNN